MYIQSIYTEYLIEYINGERVNLCLTGLILQGYIYVWWGFFCHIGLNVKSIVMLFHGFRSTA